MTREEKVKMLADIFKGKKPINEVLPTLSVSFIESKPGSYVVPDLKKIVRAEKIQDYLSQLKDEFPKHVINTSFIYHEEYRKIRDELEAEY